MNVGNLLTVKKMNMATVSRIIGIAISKAASIAIPKALIASSRKIVRKQLESRGLYDIELYKADGDENAVSVSASDFSVMIVSGIVDALCAFEELSDSDKVNILYFATSPYDSKTTLNVLRVLEGSTDFEAFPRDRSFKAFALGDSLDAFTNTNSDFAINLLNRMMANAVMVASVATCGKEALRYMLNISNDKSDIKDGAVLLAGELVVSNGSANTVKVMHRGIGGQRAITSLARIAQNPYSFVLSTAIRTGYFVDSMSQLDDYQVGKLLPGKRPMYARSVLPRFERASELPGGSYSRSFIGSVKELAIKAKILAAEKSGIAIDEILYDEFDVTVQTSGYSRKRKAQLDKIYDLNPDLMDEDGIPQVI